MSIGNWSPRAAGWGLAAAVMVTLGGCGGQKEGVDTATVVVNDPSSTATAAPASATTTTAASAAPAGGAALDVAPAPAAASTTTKPADPSAAAEGWGTLKGKVTFGGDPPKPKVLVEKGDIAKVGEPSKVCASKEIDSDRLVIDPKTKGVKFVLVYFPKPTAVKKEAEDAAKKAEVVFNQKGCMFEPHVLATIKGSTVTIKSEDSVGHNADAVGLNNRFNITTQPLQAGMPQPVKALDARPGLVKCDIHSWMTSYWLVLGNPYFAVTDAEGNFEIKDVPAGEQKVTVWAECLGPSGGYLTAATGDPVVIKAGGETTKEFAIDPSKVKSE